MILLLYLSLLSLSLYVICFPVLFHILSEHPTTILWDEIAKITFPSQRIVVGCSEIVPGRIMECAEAVLGGAGIDFPLLEYCPVRTGNQAVNAVFQGHP